jgi:hypothetical protein
MSGHSRRVLRVATAARAGPAFTREALLPVMYRTFAWLFISLLLWFGLVLTGLDRFTTSAADTLLSRLIVALVSAVLFALILRGYLVDPPSTDFLNQVKNEHRSLWIGYGVVLSAVLAALGGLISDRLLRTVAQHIPGTRSEVEATITAIRRVHTARSGCMVYVSIASPSRRASETVCLESTFGARIGPRDLEVNQQVRVQKSSTPLGQVVVRIQYDR